MVFGILSIYIRAEPR